MVFFLSRLTGDPAALFLPVEASAEMKAQFHFGKICVEW